MKFDELSKNKKIGLLLLIIVPLVIIAVAGSVLGVIYTNEMNQLDKILVASYPIKTKYFVGEEYNFDGLEIQVIKRSGDFYYITDDECTFTGFDSSTANSNLEITVEYKELTTSFFVSISERPVVKTTLKSIYLSTLPKTEYKVGESLDTTGGVIQRVYSDGSERALNLMNKYIYNFNTSIPGTFTVDVIYIEEDQMASTTYEITVSE